MSGERKTDDRRPDLPVLDLRSLGQGLRLIKRGRLELTREKAEWALGLRELAGDRNLKNFHVDYLVSTMKRGTFHPEWVTLITCRYEGEAYRMNGQHTCWARLEMPENWPCQVELIEYEAEAYDDMRMLYASIDRSSPRTKSNVIDSYLQGLPEFQDVKHKTLEAIPAGYALFKWPSHHERKRQDGDSVAYHIRQVDLELVLKVLKFLDGYSTRTHRHVFRAAVVAAMFLTFQKVPTIAPGFWGSVADGVGFERPNDARNRLRSELLQSSIVSTVSSGTDKKRVTSEYMLRTCLACWNAWRQGRDVKVLKVTEKGRRPAVE